MIELETCVETKEKINGCKQYRIYQEISEAEHNKAVFQMPVFDFWRIAFAVNMILPCSQFCNPTP